ncbi:MAG: energy-coupling factor transporter transmembrane protein EcfT [Saccharofermentans sp.]|nr:energy-coupling factor transporter transmembrane protein EcfT [Saccharofermentans sp.]
MLNDISLGRYIDTGSVLHKMDPRVKFVIYLLYLVAIFTMKSKIGILVTAVVVVLQIILSKMSPKNIWSTVKPILPITIFIVLLNLFTIKTGKTLWQWKFLQITTGGIDSAVFMGVRLIFLVLITSTMLTLSTTPLKISDALEKLLSPLKVIKVPVHEMAMMMSIALRFIPTLLDETDKIMKAQQSRGADYDTGSIINRLKGYVTVLIPLFISSFKRAEELAVAMDARCYRGGDGRTKLNPLKITSFDITWGAILLVGAAVIVVVNIVFK